jgi:hypothetical protein
VRGGFLAQLLDGSSCTGYLGFFYVEKKLFEFKSDVRGGVRLAERSNGVSRSVIKAWPTVFWFLLSWDNLTQNAKTHENWRTFRFGNIVYVI